MRNALNYLAVARAYTRRQVGACPSIISKWRKYSKADRFFIVLFGVTLAFLYWALVTA